MKGRSMGRSYEGWRRRVFILEAPTEDTGASVFAEDLVDQSAGLDSGRAKYILPLLGKDKCDREEYKVGGRLAGW